jgi:nitrogen regulatory protein P-II 1
MKLIIAVIQPYRLEEVKAELYKADVNLMTVSEVMGHGRQRGVTEVYRGVKESGNLLRKIQLMIAVNEDYVKPTVDAIIRGAHTGEVGDGKIFVLDLHECIRIRTGENGGQAIG